MSNAIKILLFLTLLMGLVVSGLVLSAYLAQRPIRNVNANNVRTVSASTQTQTEDVVENAFIPSPKVSMTQPNIDTRFYPLQIVETVTSARSSNGTHTLILKKSKSDKSTKYTANVDIENSDQNIEIFSQKGGSTYDISIPYNAWSPDNMYVYFETTEGSSKWKKYHVYRADGDLFASDAKSIDISSRFYEEVKDHVITDVTGWGSYGTLVINTDTLQGEKGPSYWYDVPSNTVTRLWIRFD